MATTLTGTGIIYPDAIAVDTNPTNLRNRDKAMFSYGGNATGNLAYYTLINRLGITAGDYPQNSSMIRVNGAGASFGGDQAIFGYGLNTSNTTPYLNNFCTVSFNGNFTSDIFNSSTARHSLAAAGYGTDKAIFAYGYTSAGAVRIINLVNNIGSSVTETYGTDPARYALAAAGYGTDKAIFGYGITTSPTSVSTTNLVSNLGVVVTATTSVDRTARYALAAAGYGTDKAIFGYGFSSTYVSLTNLVSNVGGVASDTTGVGTARYDLAASSYGGDKAIFGFGYTTTYVNMTNKVSNVGVVASDTTNIVTAKRGPSAAGFGS